VNAPLRRLPTDPAPIEEVFAARCEARALLHINGLLSLHEAVDELQACADRIGLDVDEAQAIMSHSFATADLLLMPADQDRVADIVRSLELADPRDAWRHTGEAPPPPEVRNGPLQATTAPVRPYRTPQATIDAFFFVTRLDDPDYLARWLDQHPADEKYLCKLWKAKNAKV
jgi:hypothetical protein